MLDLQLVLLLQAVTCKDAIAGRLYVNNTACLSECLLDAAKRKWVGPSSQGATGLLETQRLELTVEPHHKQPRIELLCV